MNKSLVTFCCILGVSINLVQAESPYNNEQLVNIIQEDLKELQQVPKSKKIEGERMDLELPKNVALAHLEGNPKGSFIAEYVNTKETVDQWKSDFIAQQRSNIPLEILAQLSIRGIQQACPSRYLYADVQRPKDHSRIVFTYFCYLPIAGAPLGEGGIMAFVKGKKHSFKFWNAWRPQSEADFVEFNVINADRKTSQKVNLGLDPAKYFKFFTTAMTAETCDPQEKKVCKFR